MLPASRVRTSKLLLVLKGTVTAVILVPTVKERVSGVPPIKIFPVTDKLLPVIFPVALIYPLATMLPSTLIPVDVLIFKTVVLNGPTPTLTFPLFCILILLEPLLKLPIRFVEFIEPVTLIFPALKLPVTFTLLAIATSKPFILRA